MEDALQVRLAAMALMWKHPKGDDLAPWLNEVKECGYEGVSGFIANWAWGRYIEEWRTFKGLLEANGLALASVDEPVHDDVERYKAVLEFMDRTNCNRLVLIDNNRGQDRKAFVERLHRIGELTRGSGIEACLHNNTNSMAMTYEDVTSILSELSESNVSVMLDLGHATKDFVNQLPEERATRFLAEYWSRVRLMEFKDWHPDTDLNTCVGDGLCDYPSVFDWIKNKGYSGWIVVEQNGVDASGRTAMECAVRSLTYIREGLGLE